MVHDAGCSFFSCNPTVDLAVLRDVTKLATAYLHSVLELLLFSKTQDADVPRVGCCRTSDAMKEYPPPTIDVFPSLKAAGTAIGMEVHSHVVRPKIASEANLSSR